MNSASEQAVVKLALEGYDAFEIADAMNFQDTSEIYKVSRKYNIKIQRPDGSKIAYFDKTDRNKQIVELKEAGASNIEIARRFGLSDKTIQNIYANSTKKYKIERYEKAIELIKDGYTAKEVVEMCNYANASCVYNLARQHGLIVAKFNVKKHEAMRRYKAEGHTMGEVAEKFGVSKGTAQNICKGICPQKSIPPKPHVDLHPCPVCGKMTNRPKYCSDGCQKKALWHTQNIRRRAKIENALVDKDITLHKVFERDKGRCQICGGVCDWDDHRFTNGRFVCGKTYPTIDHIVPLDKGGTHSWDNVQLAHQSCNSAKGAKLVG